MNSRLLKDEDWETLCKWWEAWPEWANPPKSFLPDNGKGGLMVEKDGKPIAAPMCRECTSQPRCSKWNGKYPYESKEKNL